MDGFRKGFRKTWKAGDETVKSTTEIQCTQLLKMTNTSDNDWYPIGVDSDQYPGGTFIQSNTTALSGKYLLFRVNIGDEISTNFSWNIFFPAILAKHKDCNGVDGGNAYIDNCGTCVGGNTGATACIQYCNGDWGGIAVVDECGVCGGSGGPCPSCTLTCSSTGFSYSCGSNQNTTTYEYCSQYSSSLYRTITTYSNSSIVTCTAVTCGKPFICISSTGEKCTIN